MRKANELIDFIKYGFFVIFHPFKGFYSIRHENIGSSISSAILVLLVWGAWSFQKQYASFLVNPYDVTNINTLYDLLTILIIYLLWCIANWSVTTLMEGKGRMRDIIVATGYSLIPYIIFTISSSILSNFLIDNEQSFYYMLVSVGILWSTFLLFFGVLTIHDYTLLKTAGTLILTVFAALVIVFLMSLCLTLMQHVFIFAKSIYTEIIYQQ